LNYLFRRVKEKRKKTSRSRNNNIISNTRSTTTANNKRTSVSLLIAAVCDVSVSVNAAVFILFEEMYDDSSYNPSAMDDTHPQPDHGFGIDSVLSGCGLRARHARSGFTSALGCIGVRLGGSKVRYDLRVSGRLGGCEVCGVLLDVGMISKILKANLGVDVRLGCRCCRHVLGGLKGQRHQE
jgi:hypothetical protein